MNWSDLYLLRRLNTRFTSSGKLILLCQIIRKPWIPAIHAGMTILNFVIMESDKVELSRFSFSELST